MSRLFRCLVGRLVRRAGASRAGSGLVAPPLGAGCGGRLLLTSGALRGSYWALVVGLLGGLYAFVGAASTRELVGDDGFVAIERGDVLVLVVLGLVVDDEDVELEAFGAEGVVGAVFALLDEEGGLLGLGHGVSLGCGVRARAVLCP